MKKIEEKKGTKDKTQLKELLKHSQPPLFSIPVEQAVKTIEENKKRLGN